MATNRIFARADQLAVMPTEPSGAVAANSPVLVGQLPGVALTAKDGTNPPTIQFDGAFDLLVKGETTVNAAIAVGDILYYDAAATPHKINKDNTNGVRFGYALEAVASGQTDTIRVKVGY